MWPNVARLFAAILLASAVLVCAQNPENPAPDSAPPPKPQFFAGTVTSLDGHQITVTRKVVGRHAEKRTFLITEKTKMSKSLRVKARVTVRYEHLPEGDMALEISIHPRARPPRQS